MILFCSFDYVFADREITLFCQPLNFCFLTRFCTKLDSVKILFFVFIQFESSFHFGGIRGTAPKEEIVRKVDSEWELAVQVPCLLQHETALSPLVRRNLAH